VAGAGGVAGPGEETKKEEEDVRGERGALGWRGFIKKT
jgi:hypothetical protein